MAADRLNRVLNALNKRRVAEGCKCRRCEEDKARAAQTFICKYCGFSGRPVTAECDCRDDRCRVGYYRGVDCSHGMIGCPVCNDLDGDVDPWEIIKEARKILTANEE